MLATEEGSVEVGSKNGTPVFQCCVFRVVRHPCAFKAGNSGIIHDHIEFAVVAKNVIDHGGPLCLLPHVQTVVSGRSSQRRYKLASMLVADVCHSDPRSFRPVCPCYCCTDACRGT